MVRNDLEIALDQILVCRIRQTFISDEAVIGAVR